ncbi:MAG: sigma-70 family RNA polymerase sigma factor [Planctomycetaceae bacterium]|nr:sigma-70 family RNA polymerase sigma factor [Planctomycetaceae bacterium]
MGEDRTDQSSSAGAEGPSFAEFIRRIRAGDKRAAAELVERYEPVLRRVVRVRLRNPRLRRLIESVDICQSVFASFFVRTALGQYDLESPDQLLRLLATIVRNKLAGHARRERADRRDPGRINPGAVLEDFPAPGSSPSRQLAARELIQEARRRMTPDERRLLERREQGLGWAEIAAELGGSPDALRVRLARAVARITKQLGLDEGPDE